jgi:hypothetical protein
MKPRQPFSYAGISIAMLAIFTIALNLPSALCAPSPSTPTTSVFATGLQGPLGSTVGPDGALYVAEGAAGRIARIDPRTGHVTTFASGLPKTIPAIGLGGPTDVAFIAWTVPIISKLLRISATLTKPIHRQFRFQYL